MAPTLHLGRLAAALAAFFLAVGVSAHALDELHGRPLQTRLGRTTLIALATSSLAGAVAIGVIGTLTISAWLAPLVAVGAFLVVAYNLELFGGRVHDDVWFALAWGGFPAFTGYFVNALQVRPAGVLVAAACCLFSVAQRRLSTPVRDLRRRTADLSGAQTLTTGETRPLDAHSIAAPLEGALGALWIALVLLAIGAVAARL